MSLTTVTSPFPLEWTHILARFALSSGQHSSISTTHLQEAKLFAIWPNTTSACTRYHHLRDESISSLADKYNVTTREILEWNRAGLGLQEGWRVCVGVEQPELELELEIPAESETSHYLVPLLTIMVRTCAQKLGAVIRVQSLTHMSSRELSSRDIL